MESVILPQIDLFTGPVFEEVCKQFLWHAGLVWKITVTPARIGNWWNADEEIDLIALSEQDTLLVECKWTTKPLGTDVLANLERKSALVGSELGSKKIGYGLCARSGFTAQLIAEAASRQDVMLYDLPEIFA